MTRAAEPLSIGEEALAAGAAVAGVGVGALGLASSFQSVTQAAARWGFTTPELLPVGIDIAIPVFTIVHLLLIRADMRLGWVRFVPWALTLVTCGLNIAAGHSLAAKVAHGTMPLLWVVLSEVAAHVYAVRIGEATGRRMERIRRSRWLLAPLSSFLMWRRMTLWELTSYTEALAIERERRLARADLREAHGRLWRTRASHRTRVLLSMGELAPRQPPAEPPALPAAALPTVPEAEPETPVYLSEPVAETPPARSARPRARKATGPLPPAARAPRQQRTWEELLEAARQATAEWEDARLTAEALRVELHTSQANARMLRDALKAERTAPAAPELHSVPAPEDAPENDAADAEDDSDAA